MNVFFLVPSQCFSDFFGPELCRILCLVNHGLRSRFLKYRKMFDLKITSDDHQWLSDTLRTETCVSINTARSCKWMYAFQQVRELSLTSMTLRLSINIQKLPRTIIDLELIVANIVFISESNGKEIQLSWPMEHDWPPNLNKMTYHACLPLCTPGQDGQRPAWPPKLQHLEASPIRQNGGLLLLTSQLPDGLLTFTTEDAFVDKLPPGLLKLDVDKPRFGSTLFSVPSSLCELQMMELDGVEWSSNISFGSDVNLIKLMTPTLEMPGLSQIQCSKLIVATHIPDLATAQFPQNVKSLRFQAVQHEWPPHFLSTRLPCLEKITMPYLHPITQHTLPSTLTELCLTKYDHPLLPHSLPASLKKLQMVTFNSPLLSSSIPPHLRELSMNTFNQSLLLFVWPQTLRYLSMRKWNNEITEFPPFLSVLILPRFNNFSLGGDFQWPRWLKHLELDNYCMDLNFEKLPKTLKTLYAPRLNHDWKGLPYYVSLRRL